MFSKEKKKVFADFRMRLFGSEYSSQGGGRRKSPRESQNNSRGQGAAAPLLPAPMESVSKRRLPTRLLKKKFNKIFNSTEKIRMGKFKTDSGGGG